MSNRTKKQKNLYSIDDQFLEHEPIHDYEIATQLATPSALSHFTAFHIHELTDQIPLRVFVTAPTNAIRPPLSKNKIFTYLGTQFKYLYVKEHHFFGIENRWRGEVKIPVTDLERTLLDGLTRPQYCGGMREVIHAFTIRTFSIEKIIDYALRLGKTVSQRLGWVLEHTGYEGELLGKLENSIKSYVKLDPSGKAIGKRNKRWKIIENA